MRYKEGPACKFKLLRPISSVHCMGCLGTVKGTGVYSLVVPVCVHGAEGTLLVATDGTVEFRPVQARPQSCKCTLVTILLQSELCITTEAINS